jgi:hypothetical protein
MYRIKPVIGLWLIAVSLLILTGVCASTAPTTTLSTADITAQAARTRVASLDLQYRTATPYGTYTITPSGSLLPTDKVSIKQRFQRLTTVAGFKTKWSDRQFGGSHASFGFTTTSNIEYAVSLNFLLNAHDAYLYYLSTLKRMRGKGQVVAIGDGATVDGANRRVLAVMHYRNVAVEISAQHTGSLTPVPLTDEQVIAVLKDVLEQMLKDS